MLKKEPKFQIFTYLESKNNFKFSFKFILCKINLFCFNIYRYVYKSET